MSDKQSQNAGDNAQQIQVGGNLIIGIDEKRAREIYQEQYAITKQDFTQEALATANERVRQFEEKFIPQMLAVQERLSAFTDPGFQFLLGEAQKTAAGTEREADYELLSELLINRVEKGQNRQTRTGINRAVEIVGDIDDDALLGLTVCHTISSVYPQIGNIEIGLDSLDNLFEKIVYRPLPKGDLWLDHLDMLDTIRIHSFTRLNKIQEIYREPLEGYMAMGIKAGSDNHHKTLEVLQKALLPLGLLTEHVLNPGYMRLDIAHRLEIQNLNIFYHKIINGMVEEYTQLISDDQKQALHFIYKLYEQGNNSEKQDLKEHISRRFMEEWDKRPHLRMLREWWDTIPAAFQITTVGKVLAHANAQRCEKNLPSLW